MKTVLLTRNGFEIRDVEEPRVGPGEVRVRASACGVCEGDTVQYRKMTKGEKFVSGLGHEGSGIVEAVGEEVTSIAVGDRVTAIDGRYAEAFLTRPERLAKVPAGIDPLWAMGEPVACVIHAASRFGVQLGDRVAVLGCGFMGLLCLQTARLQGATELCAMDLLDWRLETAKELGADVVLNVEGADGQTLAQQLGEFDVVIEAVGNQPALEMTWPLVKQHGRVVLIGYHQTNQGLRTVNMERWNFKAIDVINGHVRRDHEKVEAMRRGLELMAAGRLQVEPLVAQYNLVDIDKAFQDLMARKQGLYKVALVP